MLIARVRSQAAATPDKPAFIRNGVACSYAEFGQRIARASRHLAAHRLSPGTVAVLCIDDLVQAWIAGIALRHLGLVTVAVPRPEDIPPLELDNISCLLTWAPEDSSDMAERTAQTACTWIRLPPDISAEATANDALDWLEPRATPGGHIMQTSGTTGFFKKVLRDPVVEAATIDLHAEINGITAASVVYVRDFPLWTAGGYRWPLLSWHQGATVVFQQHADFHLPLLSPTVTHAYATPITLMFVSESAPQLPIHRNDGLRLLVTGGAMPRALAAALQQRLTRQVYSMLASTEAATISSTLVEDLDDLPWHRVHPSRDVQVVNEADEPLPVGQVGLFRVRILDGVDGYLNDELASRTFFRDGYFYPGDLAVFREDGRLAMCGRVTDVINVLGHKIATAPIEAELQNRLSVNTVCLLSLPGPGGDEDVHVVIETPRHLTPAQLKSSCEDVLGHFGAVYFHQFRELPRNRMGKVLRAALHRQLLARRTGQP